MARIILFFLTEILILTLNQQPAAAQHLNVSKNSLTLREKVDSTFNTNFLAIGESLHNQRQVGRSEFDFIYVLDFMSGRNFFPIKDYLGVPQLSKRDLTKAKNWYHANRSHIEWLKLKRGIALMDSILTDKTIAELEALRIN